eukprot:TRINITY_DN460_c0_g1_i1.p1 TRINITY_DN460_c0_g1~~TRINITY_DN460_c0_g1_i1.p1  ORF type:complete len:439 (+),score=65.80 TRINITY_DN460_c0_g1_i1:45-1361(+)
MWRLQRIARGNRFCILKKRFSTVIKELQTLGVTDNVTDIPDHVLKDSSVYFGIDPTSDSLHIGHLISVTILKRLQRVGIKPVLLIGGATGQIGDPSGKQTDRPILSVDEIENNMKGLNNSLRELFGPEVIVKNNYDWYKDMGAIPFLRDVGRYFRLGNMLNKASVQSRLGEGESGMSFTEFSYQLLQGYDFAQLYQKYNCKIQLGGADQWGNIVAGIDYIRKTMGQDAYAITVPLLTTSTGKKIGKSEGNAVWLRSDKTSPYQFYQWLYNTTDEDVPRFLRYFTLLSLEEILEIEKEHNNRLGDRYGQKILAETVTEFVHGKAATERSVEASRVLFGGSPRALKSSDILEAFKDSGNIFMLNEDEVLGQKLIDVAMKIKIAPSKGELKRLIPSGGLYLNNNAVDSIEQVVKSEHLIDNSLLLLRVGKKNIKLIKLLNK